MSAFTELGRIPFPDRIQRLLMAACLMVLNVFGLLKSADWLKWTALVVQVELLLTGLAGWCPIYLACRVGRPANNKKCEESPED